MYTIGLLGKYAIYGHISGYLRDDFLGISYWAGVHYPLLDVFWVINTCQQRMVLYLFSNIIWNLLRIFGLELPILLSNWHYHDTKNHIYLKIIDRMQASEEEWFKSEAALFLIFKYFQRIEMKKLDKRLRAHLSLSKLPSMFQKLF